MKKRGLIERLEQEPVICAEGFLFDIEKNTAVIHIFSS